MQLEVIHRDLKLARSFYFTHVPDEPDSSSFIDFGIFSPFQCHGRAPDEKRLTVLQTSVGTPACLAPGSGLEARSRRADDIYAFGR